MKTISSLAILLLSGALLTMAPQANACANPVPMTLADLADRTCYPDNPNDPSTAYPDLTPTLCTPLPPPPPPGVGPVLIDGAAGRLYYDAYYGAQRVVYDVTCNMTAQGINQGQEITGDLAYFAVNQLVAPGAVGGDITTFALDACTHTIGIGPCPGPATGTMCTTPTLGPNPFGFNSYAYNLYNDADNMQSCAQDHAGNLVPDILTQAGQTINQVQFLCVTEIGAQPPAC